MGPEVNGIVEWAVGIAAVGTAFGFIVQWITTGVKRDVQAVEKEAADLRHSFDNQTMRVEAIERQRTNDVERIVKLESSVQSIDKTLERMERGQDKLGTTINDRFDVLAESIREIRTVTLRP